MGCMPGHFRIRALVALGALAACAVAPTLAPAMAAKEKPQGSAAAQGGVAAGGVEGQGAIGVKGVSQGSPAFERAQRAVTGSPAQIAAAQSTGLEARVGSLPFTGWDLIILAGVTMVLAGMGCMLHRLSHSRPPYA
jgi:hypothetical protein